MPALEVAGSGVFATLVRSERSFFANCTQPGPRVSPGRDNEAGARSLSDTVAWLLRVTDRSPGASRARVGPALPTEQEGIGAPEDLVQEGRPRRPRAASSIRLESTAAVLVRGADTLHHFDYGDDGVVCSFMVAISFLSVRETCS